MTPGGSGAAECERRGIGAVVSGCIDLLDGKGADDTLIVALGGPPAEYVLAGREGGKGGYWPRVWAARGLLYAWSGDAETAIIRATTDEAWRVREKAPQGIARHPAGGRPGARGPLEEEPPSPVRAPPPPAATRFCVRAPSRPPP